VPPKLNPVGPGWKQDIGDQPGISAVVMTLLFSLLFSSFYFFIVLFDRQNAYWKAFLGIFRSRVDKKGETLHSIRAQQPIYEQS